MTGAPHPQRRLLGPAVRGHPRVLAGSVLLLAVLAVVSLGVGSQWIAPGDALRALTGRPAAELHALVVTNLRLPRVIVAITAGAMLGLAGSLLQTIARNDLAAPELTGVSAGVVFLSVLWLAYGPQQVRTGRIIPLVAFVGGVAAGLVAYVLSRRGRSDPLRLVLAGVLVAAILQSATSLVVLLNQGATGGVVLWAVGSLNGRVWTHWNTLWPWAAILLPATLASAGMANVLQLGDDIAIGVGLRLEAARGALLLVAALLTAGALAVVGAIGFIGLIAPHTARRLVGQDARRLFPLTATCGALLLLGADTAARGLAGIAPVPTGAITAIMGSVFFLYLLRHRSQR